MGQCLTYVHIERTPLNYSFIIADWCVYKATKSRTKKLIQFQEVKYFNQPVQIKGLKPL